jgi:uncharacterized protein (UPF0332 family)
MGEPSAAASQAYLAAFAAAQAYIARRAGATVLGHAPTRSRFAELAAGDGLDAGLSAFLARGFELKQAADYEAGPEPDAAQAEAAIRSAEAFLGAVEAALSRDS